MDLEYKFKLKVEEGTNINLLENYLTLVLSKAIEDYYEVVVNKMITGTETDTPIGFLNPKDYTKIEK